MFIYKSSLTGEDFSSNNNVWNFAYGFFGSHFELEF